MESRNIKKLLLILVSALCLLYPIVTLASADEVLNLDLFIKEHKFEPAVIEVPAGVKIKLTIHNQDPMVEEFESADLKREKIIPGNSQTNIILAPLKVGEYKFFGEFHEDTAQGKIIVTEVEQK